MVFLCLHTVLVGPVYLICSACKRCERSTQPLCCCCARTVAEAVPRAELKVRLVPSPAVGAVAPAPVGQARSTAGCRRSGPAQAAPSPAPRSRPETCDCIVCRMGNLPLRHSYEFPG